MGFFQNLNRFWSGLDFTQGDENRRQREQFAKQDREEDERRKQQAINNVFNNTPRPGSIVTPTPQAPSTVSFDPTAPLQRSNPIAMTGFNNPILEKAQAQTPEQIRQNREKRNTTDILEQLTEANMEQARKDATQGEGWFGRNILNRKAIEERAKTTARNRATRQYQDKYGWNADPAVLAYGKETSRLADVEGQRLRKDLETLNKVDDFVTDVGEVASYIPVTGSVMNLGLAGTEKLYKATGNEAAAQDIGSKRLELDAGMTQEEFDQLAPQASQEEFAEIEEGVNGMTDAEFAQFKATIAQNVKAETGETIDTNFSKGDFLRSFNMDTQQKIRNMQNLGLILSPLDFVGAAGLARSGVTSAGKAAFKTALKTGGKAYATKEALKAGGKAAVKEAAVPFVAGAGLSTGAQAYMGGWENVDPFEAAKTGGLVAGTSLLFPSSTTLRKAPDSIDDVARVTDDVIRNTDNVSEAARTAASNLDEEVQTVAKKTASVAADEGEALPGTRPVEAAELEVPKVTVEDGVSSTNLAKIPDPTSPIALGRADEFSSDVPIANFNNQPVEPGQLQRAATETPEPSQLALSLDEIAAQAEPQAVAETPPLARQDVDAQGNPLLKSDAQVAQELADQGLALQRGDSAAGAAEEALAGGAREAEAQQVVRTEDPASLRERESFAATEQDAALAQEILDTVPGKIAMNQDEMQSIARQNARSRSAEELVRSWSEGRDIPQDNPQAWMNALEERKVLNALTAEGVAGAREARINLADAMSKFQSKSGQNLNMLKVAYEEMPTDMKTELLIKKIDKARRGAGMEPLTDVQTSELLTRVEIADQAANRLSQIETEMADFNRSIMEGSATPEARQRLENLKAEQTDALADLYAKNAEVTDYFGKASPDAAFGEKLANWNRVSMLSSLSGRIFDMISTTGTATLDNVNRALSGLIGRGLNRLGVGEANALEAMPQFLPGLDDLQGAGQRTLDSARGKAQVRDVMAEVQGMATGRSELSQTNNGRFRNMVRAGTEAPTEFTRYIEDSEMNRIGLQRAQELGLKGEDAQLYADSYSAVATAGEKFRAQEEHMKANMLHNNAVSRKIDAVANTLMRSENGVQKSTGAIIKSIVAPFTRFIGGMTHRTFTDMNVISNVNQMRKAAMRGDTQALADNMAKLTTNTGLGIATAAVLAESGMLVDHDANGDSWAGLYFKFGNRYIPVGIAGLASVPIIAGYGLNQAATAENPTDAFTAATTDTLSRVLQSTGTAGFFGGDNGLQAAFSASNSAINPSDTGSNERGFADVIGSFAGQSIPAGLNDVNSVLDQIPALNPTGEAAETKVLNEDGTQNPIATQGNKLLNKIPFASQNLPRREGVSARDFIDRATKGNRETGEMQADREMSESLADWKKRLEGEKVPTTAEKISDLAKTGDYDKALAGAEYRLAELEADEDATENSKINARRDIENYKFGQEYGYVPSSNEAVEARAERGEYKAAIAGWQLRLDRDEEEGNTPESKLNTQRRKIKRYEVFDEYNVEPEMVTAYEKSNSDDGGIGVTAWRDMMESGDPELVAYAEKLYNLDKALLDAGAIKEQKYYWKGDGSSRGGRGSTPRFETDIATLSGKGYTFNPQQLQKATFAPAQSSIPVLEKLPNYSRQDKAISVKRGRKI